MAWSAPDTLIRAAVVVVATWIFYDAAMTASGTRGAPLARRFLAKRPMLAHCSAVELDGISRLVISTLLQTAFLLFLVQATGVNLWPLIARHFHPRLIGYGLALGVAEMALASMLCYSAIRLTTAASNVGGDAELDSWLALTRAGWMRLFLRTAEAAPLPVVLFVSVLYIAVEEFVFRGVLVTFLHPFGGAIAVTLPLLLFLAAQTFRMPSRASAMFPLVGALVVGVTHGALMLAVPNVVPLVVAHLAFFAFALL
jgi:hypothetical protein